MTLKTTTYWPFYRTDLRGRLRMLGVILFLFAVVTPSLSLSSEYKVDAKTGFRMDRYRAPVPDSVPGGQTVGNEFVAKAIEQNTTVLIDVYPPKGLGPDLVDGTWMTDEIRESLPGAIWLPEVGRGHLEADAVAYFSRNLARVSQDDKNAALLFFCTSDCWQSWNAVVRASKLGYKNLFWYPLGTDGWLESNGELQVVQPVNFFGDNDIESADETTLQLPEKASILLVDKLGVETSIGTVSFGSGNGDEIGFAVDIASPKFSDHFLSMRPFKCLTPEQEWFCQQPYPYELNNTITGDDFSDLEYHLLFIRKTPDQFGIDAWNGVYYKLSKTETGFSGKLLEGDLNVLQEPPPKGTKPIDLTEFFGDDAANRAYPTLIIRP